MKFTILCKIFYVSGIEQIYNNFCELNKYIRIESYDQNGVCVHYEFYWHCLANKISYSRDLYITALHFKL